MAPVRPLTRRFAKLYACVPLGVAGFCLAMLVGLNSLDTLGHRAAEAREQQVALATVRERSDLLLELAGQGGAADSDLGRIVPTLLGANLELMASPSFSGEGALMDQVDGPRVAQLRAETKALSLRFQDVDSTAGSPELVRGLTLVQGLAQELEKSVRHVAAECVADLDRNLRVMRWTLVAAVASALAFMGLALASLKRRVVDPLQSLRHSAERFGRGELAYRIRMNRSDEIGDFATTLNHMADRLSDSQGDLESRVRERTREFLRAARMAHLGVLASGIAHEINTPLASIQSCAEGMGRRMKQGEFSAELFQDYTETICREVERSRGITGRMLALAREEPTTSTVTSLSMVLEQVFSALGHRAAGRQVQLKHELPDEEINLRVDGGELVQIIINLVANAIDASPSGSSVLVRAEVNPEQLILLVKDEGAGIPVEQLEHIFEPFYTTKGPNEGTGLGLALVSNLVESHRGRVSVESEPDQGTTFRVVLPLDWRRVQ